MWTKLSAACHNVSCDIFFLLLFSIIIWSLSFLFLFASFSYGSSWSFLFFFPVFYSLLVWTTKIIRKQSNSMHSGCTYVEKVQNERQKRTRQCVSTFPEQIFRMSSNRTPFTEHSTLIPICKFYQNRKLSDQRCSSFGIFMVFCMHKNGN